MRNIHIGILGGGVMGTVLATAVRRTFPGAGITICDRNRARLSTFRRMRHARFVTDPAALVDADVIFFAIKPQDVSSLAFRIPSHALVISVMAGVGIARIREKTGAQKIIRAMPNTAAKFKHGFTVWTATAMASRADLQFAKRLFAHMGDELFVRDEQTVDRATAVSGSGPAYLLYTLQCFIMAAQRIGFSKKEAKRMVLKTLEGVHALLVRDPDPEQLIRHIASKKGTTEAALKVFTQRHLPSLWIAALRAAFRRAKELSRLA